MPRFLPDSNCMIAAVSRGHIHHEPAAREVNGRLERGEGLVVAGPALMEAYSVMTRAPRPNRVSGLEARRMLEEEFLGLAEEMVALEAESYLRLLRGAPERGIVGGRVYDAVIAECARVAGVEALLTFNERHFVQLVSPPTIVVVPA